MDRVTLAARAFYVSGLDSSAHDIVVLPGRSWTSEFSASPSFEIAGARLDSSVIPLAWPYAMAVTVNGRAVTGGLLNKGAEFQYGTVGCQPIVEPYFSPSAGAWVTFPSPDFMFFDTNQSLRVSGGQAYRYVWEVSSLLTGAPTMSVQVWNRGVGSPNNGSAGNLPLVLRVPRPLSLVPETSVFSPNEDGVFDTATFSIEASVPWALWADGAGIVARGAPPPGVSLASSEAVWDGTIGGRRVEDGVHTLRLVQDGGGLTAPGVEATISTDTTPPEVEFAEITAVDLTPKEGALYELTVRAHDPIAGGVSAGLASDSVSARFLNASLDGPVKRLPAEGGGDLLTYQAVKRSGRKAPVLLYRAWARDRVGNQSKALPGQFGVRVEGSILADVIPPAADALADLSAPTRRVDDRRVLYVKSEVKHGFNYWFKASERVGGKPLPPRKLKFYFYAHHEDDPYFWIFIHPVVVWSNSPPTTGQYLWNGQYHLNSTGQAFPRSGRYVAEAQTQEEVGIAVEAKDFHFKISDHDVLRIRDWIGHSPATSANRRAYHILAGHLLPSSRAWLARQRLELTGQERRNARNSAPNRDGWEANIRAQRDYFGMHDAKMAMSADSPILGLSLAERGLFGDYEKVALSDNEAGAVDRLKQQYPYQALMRMVQALEASAGLPERRIIDSGDPTAGPVVLPSGAVAWIRFVKDWFSGLHTAYPDWNKQKGHEDDIR